MSMDHPGDQAWRCECCGSILGPEHIRAREALVELRPQVETLTYDLGKVRERNAELEYRWSRYTGVPHE